MCSGVSCLFVFCAPHGNPASVASSLKHHGVTAPARSSFLPSPARFPGGRCKKLRLFLCCPRVGMGWSGCVSGVRDVWRRAREAFRHMPLLFFTSVALLLLRRANNNTCSSRRLSPQHPFCTRVCLNLTYSDLAPGRAVPPFLPSSLSPTRSNPRQQGYHRKHNTKTKTQHDPSHPVGGPRVSHVTSPSV